MAQTIQKISSDIDFTFTKKPVVGDVALSYDAQAVIRSVRNLLSTRHYDRLFNPDIGSNLESLLFENASSIVAKSIENEVFTMIKNYEPRASLQSVNVDLQPDQNSYSATMTFFILNNTMPTTVTVLLERNR